MVNGARESTYGAVTTRVFAIAGRIYGVVRARPRAQPPPRLAHSPMPAAAAIADGGIVTHLPV